MRSQNRTGWLSRRGEDPRRRGVQGWRLLLERRGRGCESDEGAPPWGYGGCRVFFSSPIRDKNRGGQAFQTEMEGHERGLRRLNAFFDAGTRENSARS